MGLHVGNVVLINCEVKPGPFPNERKVRCASSLSEWIGFVPVSFLEEPILSGETKLRATVNSVQNGKFSARIPGEGIAGTLYEDLTSKAQVIDTVQT